jgi:hypothetical protein
MDAREQQLDSDEAQNAIPLETCIDIPFKVRGNFISDPSLHREVGDFLDQGALSCRDIRGSWTPNRSWDVDQAIARLTDALLDQYGDTLVDTNDSHLRLYSKNVG